MAIHDTGMFTVKEINRLKILQDVIDRRLTTRLAASRLEISDRHCRCLFEFYREHGPLSLVNGRRGHLGNRQLMPGLAKRALRIIRERYADFGPTLAYGYGCRVYISHVRGLPVPYSFQTCMSSQRLTFSDKEFFMAMHNATPLQPSAERLSSIRAIYTVFEAIPLAGCCPHYS